MGPAWPFRGGIADTNEAMCRAFVRAGHQCEIITFSLQYPQFLFPGKTQLSSDPQPKDLKIHRWINSINPFSWWSAAIKMRALKPDLIIIRYWLPFMAPALGSITYLLKPNTKIIGVTDNVIPHEKRAMDKLFTRYFMGGCHAFMALSKAVKNDLLSLTQKPVDFFPHPINEQLGMSISKAEARQRLGLEDTAIYLLFFGFIRKYKGLDLLLEALADPALSGNHIKLIVAGEFYEDEAFYHREIARLKLTDRVVLKNSFIPSDQVSAYFCAADLVTQTYRTATQSGITQMALHFDRPVLVTRVGGLDEFVVEGETGLFADVDPKSIARSIQKFLSGDLDRFHDSIIREKVRFSWDAFVAKFVSFSESIHTFK